MTEENKSVMNFPNLRFPGFEGEWGVKSLGEICEINPRSLNLPDSFNYIDLESVVDGILIKENLIQKKDAPSRAQRLLRKKDVLFQMVRPYQKNNFYFNLDGDHVASTGYAQIRTQQNPEFIFHHLQNQKFVDKVIERCTGTSYPAINSSDLSKISICIPPREEQVKVSSLLTDTDDRIKTQKKIIEKLEYLMLGFHRKLLARDIRFKDENGKKFPDWEVKTLGEISIITTGSSNREDSILDGEFTFFDRSQDIRSSNRYLFDKEAIIVPGEGQAFVPKYFTGKFDLHQRTYAIFDFIGIRGKFLYYHILNDDKHLQSLAVGSTVKSLRLPMFKSMPISIPCHDEQIKIARFLSSLEVKINVEKKLLVNYENQKKFLLANLFI